MFSCTSYLEETIPTLPPAQDEFAFESKRSLSETSSILSALSSMPDSSATSSINLLSAAHDFDDAASSHFLATPKQLVDSVLSQEIFNLQYEGQPVYAVDLAAVVRQHSRFLIQLPRVKPYYAVKCNNDRAIVATLSYLGTNFDCASQAEIRQVLDLGCAPEQIIFANPCKPPSHISYAKACGVKKMTFDNASELHKIKVLFPDAELVLRILTDINYSVCQLGLKFGCCREHIESLLAEAQQLGLSVIGISFHVGSGCFNEKAYSKAVKDAHHAFQIGKKLGLSFNFLDLGGGFPGTTDATVSFERIACALNKSLSKYFPADAYPNLDVIAEPGRYYAAASHTLTVSIHSVREVQHDDNTRSYMYYVNDGAYGSFNCVLYDHAIVTPRVFYQQDQPRQRQKPMRVIGLSEMPHYRSTIWGPTCDSMDCITKDASLPVLSVGDWLIFDEMGAYTCAAGSSFNGFPLSRKVYMNTLASSMPELSAYLLAKINLTFDH